MANRIGIRLKIPFAKMDTQMTTVRITTVTSTDFRAEFSVVIKALLMAVPAQTQADNNDNRAGHDRGSSLFTFS